jgi:integrase/recombinase XerD
VEGVAFITQAVRKASLVGGSLRDVQALVEHTSLSTTSRYIETNSEGSKISGYPLIGEMRS